MKKRSMNTDLSSVGIHSRAYHQFFEGYSEFYTLNANGKRTVLRRVYTGETYCRYQTRALFTLSKFLYCLLFAAGVWLFLSATLQGGDAGCNTVWYTALPQAITIFLMLWLACNLFCYLTNSRTMTVHEYHTSSRGMIRSSLLVTCGTLLSAVTVVAYLLINLSNFNVDTMLVIGKMIVSGVFFLGIHFLETRTEYQRRERKDNIEGAIEI